MAGTVVKVETTIQKVVVQETNEVINVEVQSPPKIISVGTQGPEGAQGPAGNDGKTIRNGTSAPAGGLGVDGDFFINTATNQLYGPKTGGSWGSPVSLIGPTGATGATGPAGADGADGADGVGVPTGGTAGQILAKVDGTDFNMNWIDAPSGGGDTFFDGGSASTIFSPSNRNIDGGNA